MTYQEAYARFEEDLRNAQTRNSGSSSRHRGQHFIQSKLSAEGIRSYQVDTTNFIVKATILTNEAGRMIRETFTLDVYANEIRDYTNSTTVTLKRAS